MSGILSLAERLEQKSKQEAESINHELERGLQSLKSAINTALKNGENTLSKDIEELITQLQLTSKGQIEKRLEGFKSYQNQAESLLDQSLKQIEIMAQENERKIQTVLRENSTFIAILIFRTWMIPLGLVLMILLGMIGYGMYQGYQLKETYQEINRAQQSLAILDDQTSGVTIRMCTVESGALPCVELNPNFKGQNWKDGKTGATLQIINTRK